MTRELVAAVKAKQQEFGETDVKFARRLGVDRETWRKVRTGEILPGRRTLQGIRRAFPDLDDQLLDFFLPTDANILASSAS